MKTPAQKTGQIGSARRKRIEARAAVLIAEEMTFAGTATGAQADASTLGESTRHHSRRCLEI